MNKSLVLSISALLLLGCKKNTSEVIVQNKDSLIGMKAENKIKMLEDSVKALNKTISERSYQKPKDSLQKKDFSKYGYIKVYKNKYPFDVKLFTSGILSKRLKALLGKDNYKLFLENTDVQVPIEIVNDEHTFIVTCMAHFCNTEISVIYVDFVKDEITVGILSDGNVKAFTESKNKKEGGFNSDSFSTWYHDVKDGTLDN